MKIGVEASQRTRIGMEELPCDKAVFTFVAIDAKGRPPAEFTDPRRSGGKKATFCEQKVAKKLF